MPFEPILALLQIPEAGEAANVNDELFYFADYAVTFQL